MINKTYNVILDLVQNLGVSRVEFVQGDHSTCVIDAILQNNSIPVDLTGMIAEFYFKKANGETVVIDTVNNAENIAISTPTSGALTITMPDNMLDSVGPGTAQISIKDENGAKITSQSFYVYIREGYTG